MNSTKNYDMFEFMTANRSINRTHVNKLKKSLAEYGFLSSQPITVTHDMKVLDGQHRFIACKEMGIPIKYEIVDLKKMDNILVDLNNTQKKWNVSDYVVYYSQQGNSHYTRLLQLSGEYNISISAVCSIAGDCVQGGKDTDIIKAGNFKFPDYEQGIVEGKIERVLDACKYMGLKPSDRIIRALILVSRHPQFKWKEFMLKVEYQRDKCYKCSTIGGYFKMLENIYNNKRRNKVVFDEEKLRGFKNGNN
jgi:hypothetical protein